VDRIRLDTACRNRPGQDFKAPFGDCRIECCFHLRRDPKPVHIPERPQMPDDALPFHQWQNLPQRLALRPYLIDDTVPGPAVKNCLPDRIADVFQQCPRREGRLRQEIARGILRHRRMAARAQSTT
jgi:hypothetical protein